MTRVTEGELKDEFDTDLTRKIRRCHFQASEISTALVIKMADLKLYPTEGKAKLPKRTERIEDSLALMKGAISQLESNLRASNRQSSRASERYGFDQNGNLQELDNVSSLSISVGGWQIWPLVTKPLAIWRGRAKDLHLRTAFSELLLALDFIRVEVRQAEQRAQFRS